jgi:ssDNA thymidine ADP-ribosyltransferase, DarT
MTLEELVAVLIKRNAFVYHFTDTRNLPSIRERGILSMAELRRGNVDNVPGGNQWSLDADQLSGMDQYVHLCFFKDHPMAYVAKQEGRIENIRYLRIDPAVILDAGAQLTDRVSNKKGTIAQPARDMFTKIDWQVLYAKTDWKDPAIQARLRIAKVCELLIPKHIPVSLIRNLA